MARYFLELSYDGSEYNGWQSQPNGITIQETIEKSISKVLHNDIKIVGCGRTDTGVHASYYVAHFETDKQVKVEHPDFLYHLNCTLPRDIAIQNIKKVESDMHARFSATEREYKYYISTVKSAFRNKHAYQYFTPLDIEQMNEAAKLLIGINDFTSFAKLHSSNSTDICHVMKAQWHKDGNTLVFTISANRFLRNMVRSITGTLIDVGRGKLSIQDFKHILELRDNRKASSSAPANGLFLTKITY
ncbi:MAG: tRNA pseudouridine(38-40) synthase TruA [Rikenellaceae bacterium]